MFGASRSYGPGGYASSMGDVGDKEVKWIWLFAICFLDIAGLSAANQVSEHELSSRSGWDSTQLG